MRTPGWQVTWGTGLHGRRVATGRKIAAEVARLFDTATPNEALTVDGLVRAMERRRGRRILVDREAELPAGVYGRWVALEDCDLLQLQKDGPSREWTTLHELGHMALGHVGRPAASGLLRPRLAPGPSIVEYMLARGDHLTGEAETRQEDEAESFAGLMSVRLRQAARSATPSVQARLDETLG